MGAVRCRIMTPGSSSGEGEVLRVKVYPCRPTWFENDDDGSCLASKSLKRELLLSATLDKREMEFKTVSFK